MRIPDVNVLLGAVDESSRHHEVARGWLEEALSSDEPTGFAWLVVIGFLRISTRAPAFEQPLEAGEALDLVDGWLAQPFAAAVEPRPTHASTLRSLLVAAGVAGNLTNDAHLAAIAIDHGATLASFDADFHRFEGLSFDYLG